MKILRLGISDDTYGDLPLAQRSWKLAEGRMADATGLPWETRLAASWPASGLAEATEVSINEFRPDLVLLCCAAYWVSYPSVPLRLRRSGLPGSNRAARLGLWAASVPAIGHTAVFRLARNALTRANAAGFYFEPATALERIERVIRTVLRHEDIALAVRGPLPLAIPGSAAVAAECERRRAEFDAGLVSFCDSLHVAYYGFGPGATHPASELLSDRIHVTGAGHARRAPVEFEVMLRAWNARVRE